MAGWTTGDIGYTPKGGFTGSFGGSDYKYSEGSGSLLKKGAAAALPFLKALVTTSTTVSICFTKASSCSNDCFTSIED